MSIVAERVVKFYRCDQCKREFTWGPKSARFGSLLLEEISPKDVPVVCSEPCRQEFQARLLVGQVKVPNATAGRDGYSARLTGERVGY